MLLDGVLMAIRATLPMTDASVTEGSMASEANSFSSSTTPRPMSR